jgi:hypothetical protein
MPKLLKWKRFVMGALKKGALVLAFAAVAFTGYKVLAPKTAETALPPNKTAVTQPVDYNAQAQEKVRQQNEYNQKRTDWAKKTPEQRAIEFDARNAATEQVHTFDLKKDLDAGKVAQEQFDKFKQQNDAFVASIRAKYAGTANLSAFEQAFNAELAKAGYDPSGNPYVGTTEPATQPTTRPGRVTSRDLIPGVIALADALFTDNVQVIGPSSTDANLRGTTVRGQVFEGGPTQNITTISGSALTAKGAYAFNGKLIINGDVPPGVRLNVKDGKLVINGNVGDGVTINVKQPEKMVSPGTTHVEKVPGYGYDSRPSQEHPSQYTYHYGYRRDGATRNVADPPRSEGLLYKNDQDPAIKITGTVGLNVKANTNGGKVAVNTASVQKPAATKTSGGPK